MTINCDPCLLCDPVHVMIIHCDPYFPQMITMMVDRLVRMIANTTATPSTLLSYLDRIGLYDAIDQTFSAAVQVLKPP